MGRTFNLQHCKIDTIIKAMESIHRNSKNIMLSGGVGTGKTTLCAQIADKLGLEFYPYSLCSQTVKSDLVGFISANGSYITSALRQAYENGGLVLLDEMDAANPNVLSIINNMLSNEQYYFPDGIVEKHENFRCICAMNSNGRGNEIIYTKSQRLDASTLDRFVFIKVDIDENLEKMLADNEDWYNRIIKFRQVAKEVCQDELVIGTRALLDGADLLDAGFSQSEVEDMVIYKGIDEDIIDAIKAKMDIKPEQNNSYNNETYSQSGLTVKDGLVELKDQNNDTAVWLDEEFCKSDNYTLLESIKKELNLR